VRSQTTKPRAAWARSAERVELLALYAEADALVEGWTCACSAATGKTPDCCDVAVIGREPYPTAVELEEVRLAMRGATVTARDPRKLPLADSRPCPLLSGDGRCRIYASRPLGCRTFFCDDARAPSGQRGRLPRSALNAIGRRIADLSARFDPRDPRPRSLLSALFPGAR
jgi:putative zinc- or iron-chelating protein